MRSSAKRFDADWSSSSSIFLVLFRSTPRFRLIQESLEYYLQLQSESHRDAWTNLFLLLFTKLLKLNDEQVKSGEILFIRLVSGFFQFEGFASELYLLLSQIVIYETKAELRYLLREYFLRIGHIFRIKRDWSPLVFSSFLHIPLLSQTVIPKFNHHPYSSINAMIIFESLFQGLSCEWASLGFFINWPFSMSLMISADGRTSALSNFSICSRHASFS